MLDEFIAYLIEQAENHSIYVWGGQGQKRPTITEAWIRKREKDTGGTRVNGRYMTYADIAIDTFHKRIEEGYGDVLRAFDCSGLGVYFLLAHKLIKSDLTANGLCGLCDPVTEARRGYWVFHMSNGRATHIGYMISDKELVEAKGRQDGVVRREYRPGDWNRIGKPRVFAFDGKKVIKVKGTVRVREGNGMTTRTIGTQAGGTLPYLGQAKESPYWYKTEFHGLPGYITSNKRYTEVIDGGKL